MKRILTKVWRTRSGILSWHIIMSLLAVVLVVPLVQSAIQIGVRLSGQAALTDQDIARFLLSPLGLAVLIAVGAIIITAAVLELAALLILLRDGRGVAGRLAARLPALVGFAAHLIGRVLLIVLPLAGIIALIMLSHLSEYDINYYLTWHPPEFTRAIKMALPFALLLVGLLLWFLSGWIMALPLLLAGQPAARVFAETARLTKGQRLRVAGGLAVWLVVTLAASVLISFVMKSVIELIAPPVTAGLGMVALLGLICLLIWAGANLLIGAISAGMLAGALDDLAAKLIPDWKTAQNPSPPPRNLRWLVAGIVAAGAVITGFGLWSNVSNQREVVIIAHRGAAGIRPENTLAAMEEAIAQGADWLELDVQEDATGRVVVAHDSDFMKLAGNPLKVWEADAESLADMDVGSWFDPAYADQRVPTLREVLDLARGRARVLVELKYYGHDEQLAARVAQIVDQAGMVADTAFMSLKPQQVADMQTVRPNARVGLLAATALGDLSQHSAGFLAVNTATASPGFIARAQAAGKDVYVWTVNDPLTMARMLARGADGLITDEPALARHVIETRSEMTPAKRLMLEFANLFGIRGTDKIYRDNSP